MNMHIRGRAPGLTPAQLRLLIADEVDRLIAVLDALDGESDFEPDADGEPSLGWTSMLGAPGRCDGDDLEADDEDNEDSGDYEPSLGARERHVNPFWQGHERDRTGDQSSWGYDDTRGKTDECEEENEHGGDILDVPHDGEGDDEPSLGWTNRLDQTEPHSHVPDDQTDREREDEHGSAMEMMP